MVKDLLLNLLFIIGFCSFLPMFLEQKGIKVKKWLTILFFCIAIILCITFPIHLNEDFVFDLRGVPIFIGGLYGGPVPLLIYSLIAVGFRLLFGGDGSITTVFITLLNFMIILAVYKKFNILAAKEKLKLVVGLGILSTIIVFETPHILFGFKLQPDYWIGFGFTMILSLFILVYLIESIREFSFLREQFIRSEKMEVVSQLAASISHEVRNPMTTIKGMLQMLKETPDISADKKNQFLTISLDELNRAEKIISDYLTYAKPTVQAVQIFDGHLEIERAINVIQPLANMNCIEIETDLIPFQLNANQEKFQQCIVNLTKNAVEAMPNGGKLTFQALHVNNSMVELIISDTGVGMEQDQMTRLGMPYYTTKGKNGTGLGLMLVYRIIESMGGTISVQSKLGKGTAFTIKLNTLSVNKAQDKKMG
ncbi:ATP-binding protein [Mesobacillus subterraneus]|uniref:ATP-binding protein n=1 Tax=Mesobacillus subterraneus TaxID=285983 RepID=UPI001CFD6980|nr:sensor histidine kinase [Mesobacillus subterraneus]